MLAELARPARSGVLTWRRAKKDVLQTGTKRRSWLSDCGRCRLEEHRHPGGSVMYMAFARDWAGGCVYWRNLGIGRSRADVVRMLEQNLAEEADA